MKRRGGLFERIASAPVLGDALWRAARGKRERPEVRRFLAQAPRRLAGMAGSLRDGSWTFGPYTSFIVRDPKTRVIRAPTFADRVVHHALVAVTGPVFESGATDRSYACRRGFGQHRALRRAARWAGTSEAFLKVDIHRFYDSIGHERLLAALGRRFRERRLRGLFERLLDSYHTAPGHGLPIGALTSQYLGNFTLDPIDHWVLEHAGVRRYLRYMDDMLFFGDPRALRSLRRRLEERLAALGLRMKNGGVLNACALGVPWLGFILYPDRIRTSRRGRHRLRRRLRDLENGRRRGSLSAEMAQDRATALFAHARQADDVAWRRTRLAARGYGDDPTAGGAAGEAQERRRSCRAGRRLERPSEEVPFGLPQQEEPRRAERRPGLPPRAAPRHGGAATMEESEGSSLGPPDDAPSRAPRSRPARPAGGDEPRGRAPVGVDIHGGGRPEEKTPAGVPPHASERGAEPRADRKGEPR